MAGTEDRMKRIQQHKGVKSVSVLNSQGQTIRTSLKDVDYERTFAALIAELTRQATNVVRELDPEDGLTFLRIRTKKEEIMIAPDAEEGKYSLVVVQSTSLET